MTFALDPEVAVVVEQAGPMPAPPPVGDVEARRGALNGMLEHFNNVAQPIASDVDIVDYDVPAADGAQLRARWYHSASGGSGAAALFRHGGGMILGSVAGVSQRARADRHRVLKSL